MSNRRKSSLILIGLLAAPIIFSFFSVSSCLLIVNQPQVDTTTPIRLSQQQIPNITIISNSPKLIWIESQLTLTVISNRTLTLNCYFGDPGLVSFTLTNTNHDIIGNSISQKILLRIYPQLFVLPGKYQLSLLVIPIGTSEQHSETIEVVLGMGFIFLFCILLIFGTAIIVILTRKEDIDEEKLATMSVGSAIGSSISGGVHLPAGKIKCPGCRRIIDEGLSFCPECGDRIPEFLRFGPTSPS